MASGHQAQTSAGEQSRRATVMEFLVGIEPPPRPSPSGSGALAGAVEPSCPRGSSATKHATALRQRNFIDPPALSPQLSHGRTLVAEDARVPVRPSENRTRLNDHRFADHWTPIDDDRSLDYRSPIDDDPLLDNRTINDDGP